MTLCEQISLIDSLIKENPDTTIKDYLETVNEINGIKDAVLWTIPFKEYHSLPDISPVKKIRQQHLQDKYLHAAKVHWK